MSNRGHSSIAAYVFDSIDHFAVKNTKETQLVGGVEPLGRPALSALVSAVNGLADALGHAERTSLAADTPLTQGFAIALRDFITDLNRTANPLNMGAEHRKRVKDPAYHAMMADFYDGVDAFLNASGIPVERKGERLAVTPKDEAVVLFKRGSEGLLEQVNAIDHGRKAVVCFGGTANVKGNNAVSQGLLQLAEETLGGAAACAEGNVDLYCAVYPVAHRSRFFRDTHAYNADPQRFSTAGAKQFCQDFFVPSLQDEKGALLPMPELKKAFSRFNFFAYSYGTVFAQEMRNALRDHLKVNGVEQADMKSLLANTYCMSLGPLARLDVEKPEGHFSGVHIISETDLSIRNKSANIEFLSTGRKMIPLRENEVVIKAAAPSQGYIQDDGFADEKKAKAPELQAEKMSHNPSGHSATFYAKPVVDGEVVHNPRYVGFSLADALGLESAYRNLGEPSLPPRQPDAIFKSSEGGRISPYSAAVLNETAHKAQGNTAGR